MPLGLRRSVEGVREEVIKRDMGYSGRMRDKRKMARDQETKKWAEKRKEFGMDRLEGGPSMKQKTEELLFRNNKRKRKGLEMDGEGEQESEALEIKEDRAAVSVKAVMGTVIDEAEGLRRAF